MRWAVLWVGLGLLVFAAAWQFWMGLTHVVGVIAVMAGMPFWLLLERVFGPGATGPGYPFWSCVAVYLSVAVLIAVRRGPAIWRWGRATLAAMALWAYFVFSIGLATAPRGRYLPPMPWLG